MKTLPLALALVLVSLPASAQELYWGDGTGGILQADASGAGSPGLFLPECAHSIAVDVCTGDVYWSDHSTQCSGTGPTQGAVRRTEPGGNTTTLFNTGIFVPRGVAVDPVARRVYWTEAHSTTFFSRICSVNMDGSGVAVHVVDSASTPVVDPIGIQIDYAAGKMYWADYDGHLICHANLDGSVPQGAQSTVLFDLSASLANPEGVAIDRTANRIYWGNASGGIGWGALSGGAVSFLPTASIFAPGGVALDEAARKIYFDSFVPGLGTYEVRSFDLDTQQDTPLHAGLAELLGTLALDPGPLGTAYCTGTINSTGSAAVLCATGSTSVSANNLVLSAGPMDPGQPGIFYLGPNQIQATFGDGFRCVGGSAGTVVRLFPFALSDASGRMVHLVDNTQMSGSSMTAGASLNFQCWFRDPAAGMTGFNLSDARQLTFGP